jgi:hypothetical protein
MDRAIWTVTAGIVHGQPTLERRFVLSSAAYEEDPVESFMEVSNEAHQFFQDTSDPERVNWVQMEFVWV